MSKIFAILSYLVVCVVYCGNIEYMHKELLQTRYATCLGYRVWLVGVGEGVEGGEERGGEWMADDR